MTAFIGAIQVLLVVTFLFNLGGCARPIYHQYQIPSVSMEPTIARDELVTVRLVKPGTAPKPRRGDIIVFLQPQHQFKKYMKRVVGLPGDWIELRSNTLLVNGEVKGEPHAKYVGKSIIMNATLVPNGCVFVLGDNRNNSFDSRHFGFVPLESIIGFVRR